MRIGLAHQYGLAGSGSCIYARCLASALSSRGHDVHVISHEADPGVFGFFTAAWRYTPDGCRHPVLLPDNPPRTGGACVSHGLEMPFYPVAYPRADIEGRCPRFVSLSDEEIDEHVERLRDMLERVVRLERLEALVINHEVLMPLAARRLQASVNVPYVVVIHGSTLEYVLRCDPRYPPLAAAGLELALAVVALNEDVRQRILEFVPAAASLLVELPVGVNASTFRPVEPEHRDMEARDLVHLIDAQDDGAGMCPSVQSRLRAAGATGTSLRDMLVLVEETRHEWKATASDLGLAQQIRDVDFTRERIVTFVGKLLVDKGVHLLLAAAREVLRVFPLTRFIIIGNGAFREGLEILIGALDATPAGLLQSRCGFEDLDLLARLLERGCHGLEHLGPCLETPAAPPPRLAERVIFTGYMGSQRLGRLLALSHVNVVPSIVREAFPLVVLESAACGVLPVGTRLGGLACALASMEAVLPPDGISLLVDPHPDRMIASLAECIVQALRHSERPQDHAVAARALRRLALEEYAWESLADRIVGLFGRAPGSGSEPAQAAP